MGNPTDPKKVSIPSWQLKPSEKESALPAAEATPKSDENEIPATQEALLEQASRFLDDDSIRDAPREKKVAFLERKGIQGQEIQKLLGSSGSPVEEERTSSTPSEEMKTIHDTSATSPPPSSITPASSTLPSKDQNRDIPPIITYPEFMLRPEKPPPLITLQRVLYTLYGAAGLSTAIYGTSKYLVTPMLESLTSARHDLLTSTSSYLETLNTKLESNVSRVPPLPTHQSHSKPETDDTDAESITSDPTELFHRDIATQTSPDHSRSSSATNTTNSTTDETTPEKTLTSHTKRLAIISSHLSEFLNQENESVESDGIVKDRVAELQSYLDTLTYNNAGPSSYMNYSGFGPDDVKDARDGEDDAITKFKQEIRGVKGALLSARNFPGSAAAGRIPGR